MTRRAGRALAIASIAALGLGGQCAQGNEHGGHGGPAASGSAPPPAAAASGAGHGGHGPSEAPSGYVPITIDPSRVGPLGLATAKVEERDFTKQLRTVGIVALDETRTAHVHAKVKGFIEALPADFVGKTVKRGEVLVAIYSQTVYAAQLEFLALLRQPGLSLGDPEAQAAESSARDKLLQAARRRLMLWDVPRAQIDRLEKTLEPQRTYAIGAPRPGVLVAKQAVLGNYVEAGTELFTISDLSNLWILVDVYEADVPHVALGQTARLSVEGIAEALSAKVTFVSPRIDEATRTLKVRLDVPNASGALKPGAFATAGLELPLGRGLAVPETAVIHTGTRKIVFVVHPADGGAHVVPREVVLGPLVGSHYRVTSGLAAGENVATGAQFLIDSESRLRATTGGGGGHGGH